MSPRPAAGKHKSQALEGQRRFSPLLTLVPFSSLLAPKALGRFHHLQKRFFVVPQVKAV